MSLQEIFSGLFSQEIFSSLSGSPSGGAAAVAAGCLLEGVTPF